MTLDQLSQDQACLDQANMDQLASKQHKLDKLNQMIVESHFDKKIVLGDGFLNSKIMLIGEAPGRDEIAQGKPFVGAAGKQLNELLKIAELNRSEIYITNIVKYRISRINPLTGREVNRPVKDFEILAERQWVLREIEIINPDIICTLGNSSLRGLTGEFGLVIGEVHGQILMRQIDKADFEIFPLYHPASIIYNRSLQTMFEKDLGVLKNILNSCISNNNLK